MIVPRLRVAATDCSVSPLSQDYQTWCDLRELEHQLGQRWLTHHSDDNRWQNYATMHNLPTPRVPPTNLVDSSPENEERTGPAAGGEKGAADATGSSNGGSDHNHNERNGSCSPSTKRC